MILAPVAALVAVAGALGSASEASAGGLAPAEVAVTRQADSFEAEFRLPRAAPAWGFFRSALAADDRQPWRPRSWTVLTPGVRIERRGNYDAFVAADGGPVPGRVRVRIAPYTAEILSDYVPALRLGSDGIALFDGHFALFSVDSSASLDKLGLDPTDREVGDGGTRVRFAGRPGEVRLAGDTRGYARGRSSGAYGLFDVPGATEHDGMATVVDPDMPAWLAADIRAFTPRLLDRYRRLLGSPGTLRPTVLASWEGADKPGASLYGGVLEGLVLMRVSGAAAQAPSPPLRALAYRYVAHESAHFWLGQLLDYEKAEDNWIMEGGADLLAIRALGAESPGFDTRAALQKSLDGCLASARKGGLAGASLRQDFQAKYDCGTMLALAAERVSGGDFPRFVTRLIATNPDLVVSGAEWLALLDAAAPGRRLSALARPLLAQPQPDARGWTAFLAAAGVPLRARPGQTPELL